MGIETGVALIGVGLVKGAAAIFGAKSQANALRAQTAFQKEIARVNEGLSEMQRQDSMAQGNTESTRITEEARRIAGTQTAAYAAQGVDVTSGSAANVQADTQYLAQIDALQARNNAMRQAFGYKTEQIQSRLQTNFNEMASRTQAKQTLITGGINAFGEVASGFAGAMNYRQMYAPKKPGAVT